MLNPRCGGTYVIIVTVYWWDQHSLLMSHLLLIPFKPEVLQMFVVLFNNALSTTPLGFPNSEGLLPFCFHCVSLSLSLALSVV